MMLNGTILKQALSLVARVELDDGSVSFEGNSVDEIYELGVLTNVGTYYWNHWRKRRRR